MMSVKQNVQIVHSSLKPMFQNSWNDMVSKANIVDEGAQASKSGSEIHLSSAWLKMFFNHAHARPVRTHGSNLYVRQ